MLRIAFAMANYALNTSTIACISYILCTNYVLDNIALRNYASKLLLCLHLLLKIILLPNKDAAITANSSFQSPPYPLSYFYMSIYALKDMVGK